MKCACCGKYIRQAYYMQAGRTYGPTCGKRLGLDKPSSTNPITRHNFKSSKIIMKKALLQDGQEELFEGGE